MKKIISLIIAVSIFTALIPPIYATEEQFEYVVPCEWAYIDNFSEGLAIVRGYNEYGSAGYFGYIDRFGKIQIPLEWEAVKPFSEGLAPIKSNGKWGYINQEGTIVIEAQFDGAGMFFEDRAWVRINDDNGWNYGFINKNGELIIAPIYSNVKRFQEGLAAVCKDNLWGYITSDGQVAIDFTFCFANSFNEGFAAISNYSISENEVIIDRTGNAVVKEVKHPFTYDYQNQALWISYSGFKDRDEYGSGSYGYTPDLLVKSFETTSSTLEFENISYNYSTGYFKENGTLLISDGANSRLNLFDNEFNLTTSLDNISWSEFYGIDSDGIVSVRRYDRDDVMGYMDFNGNMVVEPQFWQAHAFYEGRAVVYDKNNRYGIIRLANDGELYKPSTKPIDTAYPAVMSINGVTQNIYMINGYGYIDVNILPKYGLNVTVNEHNNIFITRNFVRSKADVSDIFNKADSYDIYSTDKTVYVGNNVANAYIIDDKVVVWIDELNIFGTMFWNNSTKQTEFFINTPYLQNEGILWESVTDPNGISEAIFRDGYYILRTPQNIAKVYNSNFEFLFEDYCKYTPVVHDGVFKFWQSSEDSYKNELGETVPDPEWDSSIFNEYKDVVPDPYPQLNIIGRILGNPNLLRGNHSAGKCGYLDENGNVIIDYNWTDAGPFVKGTALVNETASTLQSSGRAVIGGLWGLIDTNGEYIVEPKWQSARKYSDGKIQICNYTDGNTVYGLLDEQGNELLPMNFRWLEYRSGSNYAAVSYHDGGKIHLLNLKNQIIIPPYFDKIEEQQNGTFAVASWNGASIVRTINMPLLNGSVFINNEKVEFDTPPLLLNNRTMIPIRAIFEKMGCSVQWIEDSNTVVITRGGTRVEIKQDTNFVTKNGEYIYSDTAAINYNSRMYVPLRVISEAISCEVEFDDSTSNVLIKY